MAAGRSSSLHLSSFTPIIQAMVWMIAGGVTGGLMNVLIRAAADELHPLEVVFFRNLFSLVFIAPFILRLGLGSLRSSKSAFFALRAVVAFISMVTWFTGITLVPLATATALNFTAPLFASILAALMLQERVGPRRWAAIAMGFLGVVVILRPFGPLDLNMLMLLASAATAAMGSITVKFLARSESAVVIVTYMALYLTPISFVPALFVWQWPTPTAWLYLVVLGLLGAASHVAVARALAVADASAIAPFEFMRLPYAAILGFIFFGESPDLWTWLGAAIIVASALYVAHREARLARRDPAKVSGGRPQPTPPQ